MMIMLRLDGEIWEIAPGHDTDGNSVNVRPVDIRTDKKAIAAGVTHIQTMFGGTPAHEVRRIS